MRAIERRTSLTREAFSSWPVAAWKRRLNASRFSSPSCSASWSSVLALKSSVLAMSLALQMRSVAETGDHLSLDRQLHRGAFERQRGHEIGRAHVCTPITHENLVIRLLLDKTTQYN